MPEDEPVPGEQFAKDLFASGVTRVALVAGGAWVAWSLLSNNPRARECRRLEQQVRQRMEQQFANPGELSDATYRTHVQADKNIVRALNDDLPQDQRIDVQAHEEQLRGAPLETKASAWTMLAHEATLACIADATDSETVIGQVVESFPAWLRNLVAIYVLISAAPALVTVVEKLLDFGKGGNGGGGSITGLLSDYIQTVKEGIIGDPDVAEEVQRIHEPFETPAYEPNTGIVGSPRSIKDLTSVTAETITHVATALGIAAATTVTLSEGAIDLVLEVTSLTRDDVRSNPEIILAIALVLAMWAALALIDGPFPAGEAIGGVFARAALGALGVSITWSAARDVADDIRRDLV